MEIDLNADLGEGAGSDAALMPLVTSANVCCGLHAGGPEETAAVLELAYAHGVVVGAHPGYDDRANFGRRDRDLTGEQVFALCDEQIRRLGESVAYLKPHGALYNQACRDPHYAGGVVRAAAAHQLPVVGLPDSQLERGAHGRTAFIPEGFADRRYRPDGSLVPRTEPDAFVHDADEAVAQVEWLIRAKGVRTVCVHGDNPRAVAFATAVRDSLLARGFTLKSFA